MWITFYFCEKVWCNVDNFVDRMWITSLFLNLLEIKQNELNIHVCIICPGQHINSPVLFQTSQFFDQKYFTLLDNVQFSKTLITPGYFTFPEKVPWLPEGECVLLTPTTQFSTSRPPPLITPSPPKIPKNRSRTTSTHLRKVLYFQQLSAS